MDTTAEFIAKGILPLAVSLLPGVPDSVQARALTLAISWQESKIKARVQAGGGPAHGLWQFEMGGGVVGVLTHQSTSAMAREVCRLLSVEASAQKVYQALPHNDVLAACFARLLLFTLPGALPGWNEVDLGWCQYLDAWRPGMPRKADWPESWVTGWKLARESWGIQK